jgi:hypothetical protein
LFSFISTSSLLNTGKKAPREVQVSRQISTKFSVFSVTQQCSNIVLTMEMLPLHFELFSPFFPPCRSLLDCCVGCKTFQEEIHVNRPECVP